ncbi:hypothetical protein [Thalassomonas haliotis]|uniref:Uncharacterized protein n=1 Tax=Thalassomonas haliotis TaxID=485448 RepID=A0ABY7V9J5_9GAMM|nr:hypothetical protein [Thalassomonas haliotis]WDE10243.1 hypothetical protein H3N35_18425 [Thalassomonas haliotis]
MTLNDLLNEKIYVQVQYIDTDKSTVLHENKFSGCVLKVDPEEGITIQPEENKSAVAVIPPSTEACWRDEDNVFHVNWLVYRLQEVRKDGEHEWWDWQPKRL